MSKTTSPTTRSVSSPVATFQALQFPAYQELRESKKKESDREIALTRLKREAHERNKQRMKEDKQRIDKANALLKNAMNSSSVQSKSGDFSDELDAREPRSLRRSPTQSIIHSTPSSTLYEPIPKRYVPIPNFETSKQEVKIQPYPGNSGGKRRSRKKKMSKKIKKSKRRWSVKYKRSINCKRPRGFSQKQYCKYGRNRKTRKSNH